MGRTSSIHCRKGKKLEMIEIRTSDEDEGEQAMT